MVFNFGMLVGDGRILFSMGSFLWFLRCCDLVVLSLDCRVFMEAGVLATSWSLDLDLFDVWSLCMSFHWSSGLTLAKSCI